MMPWRGRRRGPRWISINPDIMMYGPIGRPPEGKIYVYLSELEALRLGDVENLTQEEAAQKIGISRKTLWTDLTRARSKIISAILNGYVIEIIPDVKENE